MSLRLLATRLGKNGQYIVRSLWYREAHTNILQQGQLKVGGKRLPNVTSANVIKSFESIPKNVQHSPKSGFFRAAQHARKLFINNILNRVTSICSEELHKQMTKKLFYGDSTQFLALIGVTLASGTGVLSKEDELEGVCSDICAAATKLQASWSKNKISDVLTKDFNVDNLDIGPPIAKGCSAVVYAASLNRHDNAGQLKRVVGQSKGITTEDKSPIQNVSRFLHYLGGHSDNYSLNTTAATFLDEVVNNQPESNKENTNKLILNQCSQVPKAESTKNAEASIMRYPLALKMMFNYDIQSNSLSILRAMYRETIPARQRLLNASIKELEHMTESQTIALPPHPNIVCMFGFFCDEVRNLPDGHILYPIAQPQRINPLGYGRNMSLYLLMKRYNFCLRDFLDGQEVSPRTKILLLAQLLEAIAHINRHGIAHRDIKSDNLLIELIDDNAAPVLVLSDFGCCLADKVHGLQLPYTSRDIDRGGNAALMAPEIINKQPGPFAILNYEKADLWACGAIAYEIFDSQNPFYSLYSDKAKFTFPIRNYDYKKEDLPPLNQSCPILIQKLVYNLLNPNPSKRLSPDVAANVIQLFLWAPSYWLKIGGIPSSQKILEWLLSLTTKVLCEGQPQLFRDRDIKLSNGRSQFELKQSAKLSHVEHLLICNFLARARLRRIHEALNWIQDVYE